MAANDNTMSLLNYVRLINMKVKLSDQFLNKNKIISQFVVPEFLY